MPTACQNLGGSQAEPLQLLENKGCNSTWGEHPTQAAMPFPERKPSPRCPGGRVLVPTWDVPPRGSIRPEGRHELTPGPVAQLVGRPVTQGTMGAAQGPSRPPEVVGVPGHGNSSEGTMLPRGCALGGRADKNPDGDMQAATQTTGFSVQHWFSLPLPKLQSPPRQNEVLRE